MTKLRRSLMKNLNLVLGLSSLFGKQISTCISFSKNVVKMNIPILPEKLSDFIDCGCKPMITVESHNPSIIRVSKNSPNPSWSWIPHGVAISVKSYEVIWWMDPRD